MSTSALANHALYYEDLTHKTRKGGKDSKMSNTTKTAVEAPKAPRAKYAKTRGEHYKDIVIAILITAIFAFVGGMIFSNKQHTAIDRAVSAVTPKVQAQATSK